MFTSCSTHYLGLMQIVMIIYTPPYLPVIMFNVALPHRYVTKWSRSSKWHKIITIIGCWFRHHFQMFSNFTTLYFITQGGRELSFYCCVQSSSSMTKVVFYRRQSTNKFVASRGHCVCMQWLHQYLEEIIKVMYAFEILK